MMLKRLLLLCALGFVRGAVATMVPEAVSICGPHEEVVLHARGETSSKTVTLEMSANDSTTKCQLKVTAPKSYVVNLQFLENGNDTTDGDGRKNKADKATCLMSIYLPDNTETPFWKGDLCSGDQLHEVDLLTAEFNIVWTPPENDTTLSLVTTIVLTAVGSGPICKDPIMHTCMRIGRIPMLCISDYLICDGIENCPKSSTNSDEDPKLCNSAKNAWANFVVELVKKYRPHSAFDDESKSNSSTDEPSEWFEWQLVKKNATKKNHVINETHSATESISAMLNKYGPWGYLMMGLLICGTVLFFCGLWECCCKRPKPEVDPPPSTTPTTVLIMNCGGGGGGGESTGVANPMPPQYEELDLPPPYTALFPLDEGRYTALAEDETAGGSADDDRDNSTEKAAEDTANGDCRVDVTNDTSQEEEVEAEAEAEAEAAEAAPATEVVAVVENNVVEEEMQGSIDHTDSG